MQEKSGIETGLSEAEAARRLQQYGPNELPNPDRRNIFRIALGVVGQPMFALQVMSSMARRTRAAETS